MEGQTVKSHQIPSVGVSCIGSHVHAADLGGPNDDVFIMLGSDKDVLTKKENVEHDERAKKSLSINGFLKLIEGKRVHSSPERKREYRRSRHERENWRGQDEGTKLRG